MSDSPVKLFLTLLIALSLYGCGSPQEQKLLIFSKTAGYHHNSIDTGIQAISKLATENNIKVDTTTDAALFTEDNLAQYSVVIFLSTTGDVLNHYQQADFERYIQAGGGFVGIHAAADTEYDWPWYNELVGAYFQSHPHQQNANIQVLNRSHPATKHLPEVWNHFDEWYNYRSIVDGLNVLMNLDESSYEGGENGENHPIAWNREFDGGRMFYTGLGHTEEAYANPLFLQHIWGGITYAMEGGRKDYARATSARVPEANRFVREVLAFNLNEPMELDYLPGEKILFIERGGDLKLYDLKARELRNAGHLNVKRVAEDGLLGLAVDPDFAANQWIYMFYASTGKEKLQRLSRFSFVNDQVDLASEKVLLEFPATHDCCHSGGSLEFDAAGNLYLSTGDNTNPFESDGFSPSDERPGRAVYDAQKSSANTNDLRGKILRITPEADGTYSIPSGNLFEDNDPKTRPEIYAMGLRNPFRISVDQKTGILYWGDVGPDSGNDDPKRGPKGHDEINQAKGPGNWGWPYTRGNNKAYWDYDFAKKESVRPFDPVNLINNSPHNTGIQNLPSAQESFIWYGYDASREFPWLGEGGRTAMAGPVFNKDLYAKSSNGFPDYFDGKLMIYEWMRDWIFLITLDENHDFVKAEPFLDHEEFHNPMDMVFGEDGNLYILEYGESWNTQNLDAQLNRISFVAGNRAPIASITAGASVGPAPLTVSFSAEESEDLEGDPLKYQWTVSQGVGSSTEANPAFTFEKAGRYEVTLTVRDAKGLSDQATHTVVVGNTPPEITVSFDTENTFYNSQGKLGYQVSVVDAEDGSTAAGDITASSVTVALDFIPDARLQPQAVGHQIEVVSNGKKYMDNSDCLACHAVDKKINGPSYLEIAQKYSEDHVDYLKNKIKNGGAGVWGETPMAAHPQLPDEEIEEIVKYILSLEKVPGNLPIKGSLDFNQHKPDNMGGLYVLSASYTDKGNGAASSLSSTAQYTFSASVLQAELAEESHEANTIWQALGADVVGNIKDGHWFAFEDVLFDGLGSLSFRGLYNPDYRYAGSVEVWKGGPEQELLGSAKLSYFDADEQSFQSQLIRLKKSSGRDKLYIRFQNKSDVNQFIANADNLTLNYNKRE
jgi:cytochrome c